MGPIERANLVRLLRLDIKQSMGDPWGDRETEDADPSGVPLARRVTARRRFRNVRKRPGARLSSVTRGESRKWGSSAYYDRADD